MKLMDSRLDNPRSRHESGHVEMEEHRDRGHYFILRNLVGYAYGVVMQKITNHYYPPRELLIIKTQY